MIPEMCEYGRLYKDRKDKNGKTMCSSCYTGISLEDLKILWSTPAPDIVLQLFGRKDKSS